jgi:hypothetical protein
MAQADALPGYPPDAVVAFPSADVVALPQGQNG